MNKKIVKFNNQKIEVFSRNDVDESVINEIFKYQEYRAAEEIIKKATEPIIDVGAHAGFFSIYCRLLNSSAKIYALEPEPNNAEQMAKNLRENKIKNIKIIQAALAGESGKRELVITPDNHNHRLLLSGEMVLGGDTIFVKTHSLSDFCSEFKIRKISLLKMDIEGGEYEIIRSLKGKDWLVVQSLMMEYHNNFEVNYKELESILRQNGFSVQIFPSSFDRNLGFILGRNKKG